MWSLECKHQMLTDDGRRTTDDTRHTTTDDGQPLTTIAHHDHFVLRWAKKKENMERVPLVLTFSKHLPDIRGIIRRNLPELHRLGAMKEVFEEVPIVAYRRGRNLGDTLVHGKTNRIVRGFSNQPIECHKKCVVCDMLKKGIHRCDDELSKQVDRKQRCDAWNVVYGINCTLMTCFIAVL